MLHITKLEKTSPVYDITVPETQNFYADEVLVHNCNEIHLATSEERTAVCCLSSPNLDKYEEWKDTTLIEDLITMLDNVLEFFIENAPDTIAKARFSAMSERSIGLGAMGFHHLLQSKDIAWESKEAAQLNDEVFSLIRSRANLQSLKLGKSRGEAPDMKGTGERFAHKLAIAPNASSAIILSTSPSIEPAKANAYTHRTRAGSFLVKNPYLEAVLEKYGRDDKNTWSSIITNKGSVQHLSFLTEHEKEVYKTAQELDQKWVVKHAANRQRYICQGQSVNLFFPSGTPRDYVTATHILAWQMGLKGLYYLRTEAKSQAENVSQKVEREALIDYSGTIVYGKDDCPFCAMAREELGLRGIPHEYVNLDEIGKSAKEVTGREEVKSVPQIYLRGVYVGGYEELLNQLRSDVSNSSDNADDGCKSCEG